MLEPDFCDSVAAEPSVANATALLADCIALDTEKKAAKKVLDDIEDRLAIAKEKVKDLFISMGVKSMKSNGKNVYISKTIWAGINGETERNQLADALIKANMEDYITCNTTKLSSYVREIIQEHPEFFDKEGEVVADPEKIAAVLPEPFNTMIRVSEKIDIRVRK